MQPHDLTRFTLRRDRGVTGVSGTGDVAHGVRFFDGHVALRWLTEHRSTSVYGSMADVRAIHGHPGTRIVWLDGIRARAQDDAALDDMENAPNGSVARHVPAGQRADLPPERWTAPDWLSDGSDHGAYLEGYRDAVGAW